VSTTTTIEWTAGADGRPGKTWNPVTGCTRISAGCERCYIERTPPFRMNRRRFDTPQIGGTTGVILHENRLTAPLSWRKPHLVFVNSLSDLFHDEVPAGHIATVFATMARAERHTFQILTKRPARMRSLLADGGVALMEATSDEATALALYESCWPLPNVWLGVSTENQHWAATRIPTLLATEAAVRFISAEPLLGPIDLHNLATRGALIDALGGDVKTTAGEVIAGAPAVLDWVIVGGESGPLARAMDTVWAMDLVIQCQSHTPSVPVFVKQMGSAWARANGAADRKGGDPAAWPIGLRVREYPKAAAREH
jgi:protein gp37